jgi:hypothetical protein
MADSLGSHSNAHGILNYPQPLHEWNAGAGPRLLVPCDPTDGTIGGPWVIESHLFTHQVRRGVKRKAATKTVYVPVPIP